MRILLYEFIHAGGWRQFGEEQPAASLRREGAAMLAAVADDFRRLDDTEVIVAEDSDDPRASDCLSSYLRGEVRADWILLIAPETGGILANLCNVVERSGGRLLGPSSEFVRLTSDKQATAEKLASASVPVPAGMYLPGGAPLPRDQKYPAVLKPVDGAGSQETWLVDRPDSSYGRVERPGNQQARRVEEYCPGLPASVAFLCGPESRVPLLPCRQRLSDDGRFQYLGGSAPLAADLALRAIRLADRALAALPAARGYVGVDLILGADANGRGDRVIEVNPRLTTSYVGLRSLCRTNLARAMLQAAVGTAPELSWSDNTVEFESDGRVRRFR